MTITAKQKRIIDQVFTQLAYTLDNITHTKYMTELYEKERYHERHHREWTDYGPGRFGPPRDWGGLTLRHAAKYFAARHIIEGLKADYSAADSLFLKDTVFRAFAIAQNYKEKIELALADLPVDEFMALDYSELVQPREQAA
jgi:hypothetical protein